MLSSPSFDDGDPIPDRYGYTESNVNPPLVVEDVPEGAASLVLLVDDPDAEPVAGKIWDHWVVWNVDQDIGEIPEDWSAEGAVEGVNDYGERGYGGPNPPDKSHTYRFRLFALDTSLDLPRSASREEVEDSMQGHVIAKALLKGTYAP